MRHDACCDRHRHCPLAIDLAAAHRFSRCPSISYNRSRIFQGFLFAASASDCANAWLRDSAVAVTSVRSEDFAFGRGNVRPPYGVGAQLGRPNVRVLYDALLVVVEPKPLARRPLTREKTRVAYGLRKVFQASHSRTRSNTHMRVVMSHLHAIANSDSASASTATPAKILPNFPEGLGLPTGKLTSQIYHELRSLAHWLLRDRSVDGALEPTELVHETYIKLANSRNVEWSDERHFFHLVARAMRQVLADHVASGRTAKRGGAWRRVCPEELDNSAANSVDAASLYDALEVLGNLDQRKANVVTLRFLGGLSIAETARALDVSPRTVELDWRFARAWLRRQVLNESTW